PPCSTESRGSYDITGTSRRLEPGRIPAHATQVVPLRYPHRRLGAKWVRLVGCKAISFSLGWTSKMGSFGNFAYSKKPEEKGDESHETPTERVLFVFIRGSAAARIHLIEFEE